MILNSHQFHIPADWVQEQHIVIPLSPLYRQLRTVLRVHTADTLRLFDGVGGVYEVRVDHIGVDGIVTSILSRSQQPEPLRIGVAIGFLKNDRMRFAIEKSVELGATTIIPMITERTIKRPDALSERWDTIVREAAEQCGRAWLPTLAPVQSFADVLTKNPHPILCSTEVSEPIENFRQFPCTILIGPEGGFTDDELLAAKKVHASVTSLGVAQLRADTAALAALARIGASSAETTS